MKDKYNDTDLREALRRRYSDTPQLPADFMAKMQERMAQQSEPSLPAPALRRKPWRWVAAAAGLLLLIGLGITMLTKQVEPTEDIYAQANAPQTTAKDALPEEQTVSNSPVANNQVAPHSAAAPAGNIIVAEAPVSAKPAAAAEPSVGLGQDEKGARIASPTDVGPTVPTVVAGEALDPNLHYASQSLTDDSTYQAPARMDEFISKIADYNKVKAVPLECISDKDDSAIVNNAYVFRDTKELDLFSRLFQAACWYDSKTPGYLLNFSQQQFFFTLKDIRKGEKYLWMAERIDGGRILLYTSRTPIDANVSSACYQKYREQLTHTFATSHF